MAKYKLVKNRDGTYALQGILAYGRTVMAHESVRNLAKSDVPRAGEVIAMLLGDKREALKGVQDGTDVPGSVG